MERVTTRDRILELDFDGLYSFRSPASPGTVNITVLQPGGYVTNSTVYGRSAHTCDKRPDSVICHCGAQAIRLVIFDTGFLPSSTVAWNGTSLSTTYLGETALNGAVPAGLLANPSTANVTVVNPPVGLPRPPAFTVGAITPPILTWNPTSATAGGPAFTLTLDGSGFVSGSIVRWNGSALATSYSSSAQLAAIVPAQRDRLSRQRVLRGG